MGCRDNGDRQGGEISSSGLVGLVGEGGYIMDTSIAGRTTMMMVAIVMNVMMLHFYTVTPKTSKVLICFVYTWETFWFLMTYIYVDLNQIPWKPSHLSYRLLTPYIYPMPAQHIPCASCPAWSESAAAACSTSSASCPASRWRQKAGRLPRLHIVIHLLACPPPHIMPPTSKIGDFRFCPCSTLCKQQFFSRF